MLKSSLCLLVGFIFSTLAITQSLDVEVEKLPATINSIYDEFSPVVSIDGKEIFFTRVGDPNFIRQLIIDEKNIAQSYSTADYHNTLKNVYSQIAGRTIFNPTQSSFNQDIFITSSIDGQSFDKVHQPPTPLNNALPNSLCAVTGEPNTFIILNQFDPKGGMQAGFSTISRRTDGSWTFPKPLYIEDYYTRSESVNLTMSADGSVLILSLQRDDSRGVNDLYVSSRRNDGTFSTPQNLGSIVNSNYRETTPALSEDKQTLYFSSNRGRGGHNDIYMARRLDNTWTNWSKPRRFKSPINSSSDDSQPYFNAMTGYLYFTSRRGGNSDIYRVQLAPPKRPDVGLKGRIIDAETGELIENKIFYSNKNVDYWQKQQLAEHGKFKIYIPKGKEYKIQVKRQDYLTAEVEIFYEENRYYSDNQEVIIYLIPLKKGAKINTKPIYFARSTANLLAQSHQELNRLAELLLENTSLELSIEGHTDNQGKPEALQELSHKRALAVKEFLVEKGIEKKRLTAIGFGATQPLSNNASESQRKQNRRVEFKIIELKD